MVGRSAAGSPAYLTLLGRENQLLAAPGHDRAEQGATEHPGKLDSERRATADATGHR